MNKTVLVVDDDLSVRESLKKVLEAAGHGVLVATDGLDAEGKFKGAEIDLLILDMNMPRRDGWDVLEFVGTHHPIVPVVMITGMYDQLDTTIIPGVRTVLQKPVEVPALLELVEQLLNETTEERIARMKRAADQHPHLPATQSEMERLSSGAAWLYRRFRNV